MTPDRSGRYWVRFDDGTKLGLYRQSVEDFSLYPGKELTQEDHRALLRHNAQVSAKMRAVRIVSAANVSKKDLEQRLIRKGEAPQDAQQAVAWLEEMKVLDDRTTAQALVRACIAKGYGRSRAKQMLYEKRVPKELWEEVLEDYPQQEDRITDFLRTRLAGKNDPKAQKRAIDALLRRGHSYSAIRQALNELDFDTEDFPEED